MTTITPRQTSTTTSTTYVPSAAGCRVCNAARALWRKADRLEGIARGYADLAIRTELLSSVRATRQSAAAITCTIHGKAA